MRCRPRRLLPVCLATALLLPIIAHAASGSVHFTGRVVYSTCTISDDSGRAGVGSTEGGADTAPFQVALSACAPTVVATHFEAPDAPSGAGGRVSVTLAGAPRSAAGMAAMAQAPAERQVGAGAIISYVAQYESGGAAGDAGKMLIYSVSYP